MISVIYTTSIIMSTKSLYKITLVILLCIILFKYVIGY